MAIPTYEDFMLPLLKEIADGDTHRMRDLYVRLERAFPLTPEEVAQRLPSGQMRVVPNRIGWARTYLKKAGLVESPKRGSIKITDSGRTILAENLGGLDAKYLDRFESFREFMRAERPPEVNAAPSDATPEEAMDAAYKQMRDEIRSQLLDTLKDCDPYFFEQVVVLLLRAMGYGIAGHVTPRSRDGGVDGIIHEDKLGLDTVCVQAKRWDGTVGRRIVQEFVGSMDLHRSRKGVILTTSQFSSDALDYVNRIEGKKVVLIEGDQLCQLMIDHKIGVTVRRTYEVFDVSQDFFDAHDS